MVAQRLMCEKTFWAHVFCIAQFLTLSLPFLAPPVKLSQWYTPSTHHMYSLFHPPLFAPLLNSFTPQTHPSLHKQVSSQRRPGESDAEWARRQEAARKEVNSHLLVFLHGALQALTAIGLLQVRTDVGFCGCGWQRCWALLYFVLL